MDEFLLTILVIIIAQVSLAATGILLVAQLMMPEYKSKLWLIMVIAFFAWLLLTAFGIFKIYNFTN